MTTKERAFTEWLEGELAKENEGGMEGQGYTIHINDTIYDEQFKKLSVAVTLQAIEDYETEYAAHRNMGYDHERAVKCLEWYWVPFFMRSPFAQLALEDVDGETIYYTLIAHLKRRFSK